MAIIQGNAKKSTAAGGFYPKVINGSLRFNDDDSAYLSWTPTGTSGGRTKFTYSGWVKIGTLSTSNGFHLLNAPYASNLNGSLLMIDSNDEFYAQFRVYTTGSQGSFDAECYSNMKFRDPSAWYHIVFAFDSTASESSRMKLWVNGVLQSFRSVDWPGSSTAQYLGSEFDHKIGRWLGTSHGNTDGYMANVHFIDGQALTASDFGEIKNGVWVAKDYAGIFGTNGFYLTFEDDTEVEAFNTLIWRGDSSTSRDITGTGFAPDFVWIKDRNTARGSVVFDVIRGQGNYLRTNETTQESTSATPILTAFNSDGFTLGNNAAVNNSNETYVAWCWKAGGAPTVDNSAGAGNVPTAGSVKIDGVNSTSALAGSIPATRLSASTAYGFSIIKWTGDGTLGHGLNQAPEMFIVKDLTAASSWWVWHKDLSNTSAGYLQLNSPNGENSNTSVWRNAYPATATTIDVNTVYLNYSTDNYLAYCFHSVTNYSKFGSYEGNGSTNGPEIDCGFVPALVMIKDLGRAEHWVIFDGTRETQNDRNLRLFPSTNSIESPIPTGDGVRFLSTANGDSINGFKITTNSYGINDNVDSDVTKIYAAFADTREAAFWLDQSGNDNDWQPVNLDHNDTVADSPTNNFTTWNAVNKTSNLTLSNGNLQASFTGLSNAATHSTMATPQSGQWYFEFTITQVNTATSQDAGIGFIDVNNPLTSTASQTFSKGVFYRNRGDADSRMVVDGTSIFSGSGYSWATGDVIQIAYDADTGKVWVGKNNAWFDSSGGTTGSPSAGTNPTGTLDTDYQYVPVVRAYSNTLKVTANFGQQPFKYDPPA